jgi:gamma-glutamylcyclotransferase (GGCT)/AIG2-like uncharacterized protein YtfP
MRLFEYAMLEKPEYGVAAKAPGTLRWRGKDGAARFNAKASTTVHGKVVDFTAKELEKLDGEEAPEYVRVPITLSDGSKAYAYEYLPDDFGSLPLNSSGRWHKKA